MGSASTFAHKVVEVLQEVHRKKGVSFQLFFPSHSVGSWLAQVTTFTTEYLNLLNAELNASCKSQLAEFFWVGI